MNSVISYVVEDEKKKRLIRMRGSQKNLSRRAIACAG